MIVYASHSAFCRRLAYAVLLAIVPAIVPAAVRAEPPHASYMFPAGGQRGTEVTFRVGGHYLHEQCGFEMLGPGVRASEQISRTETVWFEGPLLRPPTSSRREDYPKDYAGTVAIGQDAPLGVRHWRVWTSQGATPALRFVVGELPEVVEQEVEGQPLPVPVQLPVTINGRIFPREDVDIWTFDVQAGQQVSCAVAARQLGSPLEARIEVRAPDGRTLAESTGGLAADPRLHFTAPDSGTYQVRIHDVRFDGLQHFVYRLTLTAGPWVERLYPLGGRRGSQVQIQARGQNLAAEELNLQIPETAPGLDYYRLEVGGQPGNPVLLAADDLPERLEAEPNDTAGQATPVELPVVVNGRIDQPGDVDWWTFQAEQGSELVLQVQAARLGSPLDSVLALYDAAGQQLARAEEMPGGLPDAQLRFTAAEDGRYLVRVSERFASRGGPDFAYRLRIAPAEPDFRIELADDAVSVERGGQQKLQVQLHRQGGLDGPVTLSVEGLPAGVGAEPVELAGNQDKAQIVFQAGPEALIGASHVRIVGQATVGEQSVQHTAALAAPPGEPALEHVLLAVAMPTPFRFESQYDLTFVPRGSVHRKRFVIDRGGYEGPLQVQLADRQVRHLQGVTGPTLTLPPGADTFDYPIYLPPWMELGRTSRSTVMLTGTMRDEQGREHTVCYTSGQQNEQLIALVSPGRIRLALQNQSLRAIANSEARLPVEIKRDRTTGRPLRLELVVPEHIQGIEAEPLEVPADRDQAVLTLRFGSRPGPLNTPLLIRATADQDGDPVVAETPLEVVAE